MVTISEGHLTLSSRAGEVIVDVPIDQFRASRHRLSAGAAAKISIGEDYYTIQPNRRRREGSPGQRGQHGTISDDAQAWQGVDKEFLAAVEAARPGTAR